VRVLLDEQLPRHLAREISGHEVSTVQREGWAGLTNGKLLRAAADRGFDVFVTADQNLQFQQNLRAVALRIVVLHAASNAIEDLRPLVPGLIGALSEAQVGEVRHVHA
jgi:hypothetical protein